MHKLWIFGDSLSTAYGLQSDAPTWADHVAERLGLECLNHAKPAVDNGFIYQSFLLNRCDIESNDIVIMGWTHPNRKWWIVDPAHPDHAQLAARGTSYQLGQELWFRGPVRDKRGLQSACDTAPRASGIDFFDRWFRDYHHDIEQNNILRAYRDSVKLICPAQNHCFYFSDADRPDQDRGLGTMLEFIQQNRAMISNHDYHLSTHGHRSWADHVIDQIT